jgi:hypothetical protein
MGDGGRIDGDHDTAPPRCTSRSAPAAHSGELRAFDPLRRTVA